MPNTVSIWLAAASPRARSNAIERGPLGVTLRHFQPRLECPELGEEETSISGDSMVAVGGRVTPLPPAQIPACAANAPGSCRRSDVIDLRAMLFTDMKYTENQGGC